jgi:hypothetical protein
VGNVLFRRGVREEPPGPRLCRRCRHLTAGTRNGPRNYCGPCLNYPVPKSIGWWNGYEDDMRKLGAYPKDKEEAENGVDSPVVEENH